MSQSPIRHSLENASNHELENKVSSNGLGVLPSFIRELTQVDDETGCWLWCGSRFSTGYGLISYDRLWKAHRLVWTLVNGEIPPNIQVCHKCDTPPCINPNHLFLGTAKQNQQDKAAKGRHWQQKKTHCPKGHPYDDRNTYHPPGAPSARQCRTCKNIPLLKVAL